MGSGTNLELDLERLKEIRDKMWQFQVERMEDKQEEAEGYGVPLPSYREVIGKAIMENMGKNVVQFTEALVMMSKKDIIKQGADMLNLVLMLIDKGTLGLEETWDLGEVNIEEMRAKEKGDPIWNVWYVNPDDGEEYYMMVQAPDEESAKKRFKETRWQGQVEPTKVTRG